MSQTKVPFVNLGKQYERFQSEIQQKFNELSLKGAYVLGEEVEVFEKNFAELCGTKFALGVGHGTDALMLPMLALGIGNGDEVITATNSFIASAGAIATIGAKPVLCDVGADYNLDATKLEQKITDKTKAILPVHLTGMPADMGAINALAQKYNLAVIEDAAQAIGATYKGRPVGSLGTAAGFSLHPLKNLHVHGDGGAITTNDKDLYEKMKLWRNHGLKNRDECLFFALNSRLDAIQAAIANIKMKNMKELTGRFIKIAQAYTDGLNGIVELPLQPAERQGVFHNYVIQVDRREELQEFLLQRGIETKVHYPILIHKQKAASYLGYKDGDFPVAETQVKRILSLPIYPELEDEQVSWTIDSIKAFYQ